MRVGQPLSPWWCSSRASRAARRGPAYAGFSEQIVDYRSDVTIEPDGTILVHETIVYDFGVVPKHGIFRDDPACAPTSRARTGYDRVYPLDVVSVSGSAGTPAQYTVEEDGDNERIKIGDPDRTITGEHTYDIMYRVRGAMNAFADHDELVLERGRRTSGRCRSRRRRRWCTRRPTSRRSGARAAQYGADLAVRHRDEQRADRGVLEGVARPVPGHDVHGRAPEGRGDAVAEADPRGALQLHVGVPGDARHRAASRAACSRCSPAS